MKKYITFLTVIILVISLSCFSVYGLQAPQAQLTFVNEIKPANTLLYSLNSYGYGHIDGISQAGISGWAYDSRYPDTPISVHIYIYEVRTDTLVKAVAVTAGLYRYDLEAAGYGNGYHGFSYDINWDEFPINSSYRVEAFAIDNTANPQLQNSGSIFTPVRYDWIAENG